LALNIKNPEVVQLATEVDRKERLIEYMAREVWPHIPADQLGKTLTREEEDDILGFGPDGV
jgi:antitoxin VapB